MYPEAGGSSLVRAPRVQRVLVLLRRLGARCSTTSITIAISAFFVPHYFGSVIGVDALRHGPADIFFGIGVVVVLLRWSTSWASRSRPGVNILPGRRRLPHPAAAGARRPRCSSSRRRRWSTTSTSASRRRGRTSSSRSRSAMIAYTGIETISNMAEEAKDEAKTIPAAINRVRHRGLRHLRTAAGGRAVARCRWSSRPTAATRRCSGVTEEQGGFAGDPVLGVVKDLDLGLPAAAGGDLRRPARGDDPVHRHQRRHHRRLAAGLLDGPAPPGARPPAPAAPAATARRGSGSSLFGAIACLTHDPRPGRVPGQHVRVRGDAVVHDRAHLGDPPAQALPRLRAPVPRAGQHPRPRAARCRCSRSSAASAPGWPSSSSPPCTSTSRSPASAGWRSAASSTRSTAAARASTSPRPSRSRSRRPSSDHEAEYESILVAFDGKPLLPRARRDGDQGWRRAGGAASTCSSRITVPASAPIDAELPELELGAQDDHRAGQAPGRPARDRPLREGARRQARAG